MRLLVTRPANDSDDLIARLKEDGHQVDHFPLLEIKFRDEVSLPEKTPQAVLITSANGARALHRQNIKNPSFTRAPAITVGNASATAARQAGFCDIRQTNPGNVSGLITYVRGNLKPENGPLLYPSGEKTTGDLVNELNKSGFRVNRTIVYAAEPSTKLAPNILRSLEKGHFDGVLLYSPRTAKIWLEVTKGCISAAKMANLAHYCLSENVANIICQRLGDFCNVVICKTPDTGAMLDALHNR
jgi:uroporphyrinogen-III synthase